jgi:hypothetical protein
MKVAFAQHELREEERDVAEAAFFEFLDRHPRFWLNNLRERLEATGAPGFAHAAEWVCKLLQEAGPQ